MEEISRENCSKYAHYARFAYLLFLTDVEMFNPCEWRRKFGDYSYIVKYTKGLTFEGSNLLDLQY